MALVPVHGGLSAPVDRFLRFNQKSALLAESGGMARIAVTDADLSVVYRIADGTLSPLTGFMDEPRSTGCSTRRTSFATA